MNTIDIKTKTDGKCRLYPDNPYGIAPSVTSITQVLHKGGLLQWASDCAVERLVATCKVDEEHAKEARYAYKELSDTAADFGTQAHLLCQLYLEKRMDEFNAELLKSDDKAKVLIDSFIEWADKNKIEPVSTEIVLHTKMYSGRCDLVAYRTDPKTGDKVLGLYDIKTGKGTYYPEWGLQLAAYAYAWDEQVGAKTDESIEEIGIIKLNKDTLKCNFSEQSKPKFTAERERLSKAFAVLASFYWLYNDIENQIKEIENEPD